MSIKIEKKIVKYSVVKEEAPVAIPSAPTLAPVVRIPEVVERPSVLLGATYKIQTPISEHALYVTINDVLLHEGTSQEQRHPFEIFIHSKNMDHFQWIVALTRILSSIFRKGGDVIFLVEELRSVFDPKGGYFKRGGRYMPSLVAELGDVIELHLRTLGLIQNTQNEHSSAHPFPPSAQLCPKCQTKAMVVTDSCFTCLSCGESRCG